MGKKQKKPKIRITAPRAIVVQMDVRGMQSVRLFVHSMLELRDELAKAGQDDFADKLTRQFGRFQLDPIESLISVKELPESP